MTDTDGRSAARPLRVGVDGTELGARPTGVGTYVSALLSRWTQRDDIQIVLFVRQAEHVPHAILGARNLEVVARSEPFGSRATLWQQLVLPRLLSKTSVDVLFGPAYSLPLLPGPWPVTSRRNRGRRKGPATLVALHDLSFERYPESFPTREGIRRRWLGRESANRATRVLTISRSSAAEIESLYGVPEERMSVTPLGVDPDFAALDDLPEADSLITQLGLSRPLVLSVGTLFNRRHPAEMIQAFAQVRQTHPTASLVVVGENRTVPMIDLETLVRDKRLSDSVTLTDHTSREHLRKLYKAGDVFLYLSDYEGFGLPPLEALAGGTPSIVLDRSASREYWSRHALALDSPEPEGVAQAILEVLESPAQGLKDHERLPQLYDWEVTAEQTIEALRLAAARPTGERAR